MNIPVVTLGKGSHQSGNPWAAIPKSIPYVLESDRATIEEYNDSLKNSRDQVILENLPEPFIGNPKTARVVLLNLNPGHSEGDREAHLDLEFSSAIRRNLRHENHQYPFYPLNPAFRWTPCAKWWLRHISEVIEQAGLQTVAQKLLVIEWFPYHSQMSALPTRPVCESQNYSFGLAKEMLSRNVLTIGMRARKQWCAVDPQFHRVPFPLKVAQGAWISKGNLKDDWFERIVRALRE